METESKIGPIDILELPVSNMNEEIKTIKFTYQSWMAAIDS